METSFAVPYVSFDDSLNPLKHAIQFHVLNPQTGPFAVSPMNERPLHPSGCRRWQSFFWVSSRLPGDIPSFNGEMIAFFAEPRASAKKA